MLKDAWKATKMYLLFLARAPNINEKKRENEVEPSLLSVAICKKFKEKNVNFFL